MKELDDVFDENQWKEPTEENKKDELDRYGSVYIYKNKIVPRKFLTKKVLNWFADEEFEQL